MNALLLRILLVVITMMSPTLLTVVTEFLHRLEAEAKKTGNPWDDILVDILKSLIINK